ncbi:hypothetical protein ACHAQK_011653 [Fusarium lateritium]
MGSTHDIFLCMVSALSYMRLLPNQKVLKLMPRVVPERGWAEAASCHRKLLDTIKKDKISVRDTLDIGIVVASMDFLSFAYEPYGKREELPLDLLDELTSLVKSLCSTRFVELMRQLIPVYRLQRRQYTFERIFNQFPDVEGISSYTNSCGEHRELDQAFAQNSLGLTRLHLLDDDPRLSLFFLEFLIDLSDPLESAKLDFTQDFFGWTLCHYMSFLEHNFSLRCLLHYNTLRQRLPDLLCAYSRSPIHLAALEGIYGNLSLMLNSLSDDKRKHAIQTGGIDGMTPIHLISKRGNVSCLDLVAPKGEALPLLTKKDLWGRQALHLASRSGSQEFCIKLLEMGARSDQLDGIGKSSVDYFLECKKSSNSGNSKVPYLEADESKQFLRFAMESPNCRYSHGRTFLHSAVELAHLDSIKDLLDRRFDLEAQDDGGRTPLHYAILAGRMDMAIALINGLNIVDHEKSPERSIHANSMAKDSKGTTTLMFAVRKNLNEVVEKLSATQGHSIIEQADDDGETALFYANSLEMVNLLVSKGFKAAVTNRAGRTRLHVAIQREEADIAKYLLQLEGPDHIQRTPYDKEGDSLLITACQHGLSDLVPLIHHKWNDLLNTGDRVFDRCPLAWACYGRHKSVVEELLTLEVNVNRPAFKSNDLKTPLHISVTEDRLDILNLLLDHKTIDLDQKDSTNGTALQRAINLNCISAARKLLLHGQTSSAKRIEALEKLVPMPPQNASRDTMSLVSDCLKSIKDKALVCKFLVWLVGYGTSPVEWKTETAEETQSDTRGIERIDLPTSETLPVKTPDGASADANDTQAQNPLAVFLAPLVTFLIDQEWESIKSPYELVMLLGDDELRETVTIQQINGHGFDSDMWSYIDYIERFEREDVMKALVGSLRLSEAAQRPNYIKPAALAAIRYHGSINLRHCNVHGSASDLPRLGGCSQAHGRSRGY